MADLGFLDVFKDDVTYKMEFMRYLLNHYDHNFRYEMPDIVKSNSMAYLNDNNAVHQFINEYVKKDDNGHFTLKDAKVRFRGCEYYDVKVNMKTALERALKAQCLDQKKIKNVNYRNVFVGFSFADNYKYEDDN